MSKKNLTCEYCGEGFRGLRGTEMNYSTELKEATLRDLTYRTYEYLLPPYLRD